MKRGVEWKGKAGDFMGEEGSCIKGKDGENRGKWKRMEGKRGNKCSRRSTGISVFQLLWIMQHDRRCKHGS